MTVNVAKMLRWTNNIKRLTYGYVGEHLEVAPIKESIKECNLRWFGMCLFGQILSLYNNWNVSSKRNQQQGEATGLGMKLFEVTYQMLGATIDLSLALEWAEKQNHKDLPIQMEEGSGNYDDNGEMNRLVLMSDQGQISSFFVNWIII